MGSGTVNYTVGAGGTRSAALTVAGQPFAVNQTQSGSGGVCAPSAILNVPTSPIVRANGETELVGEVDISGIDLSNCQFSGNQITAFTITFPVAVTNPVGNDGVTTDAVLVNSVTGDSYPATLLGTNGLTFTLPAISPAPNNTPEPLSGTLELKNIRLDASEQGSGTLANSYL